MRVTWEGNSATGWVIEVTRTLPADFGDRDRSYFEAQYQDRVNHELYAEAWKQLAEILGRGQPCVVHYEAITRETRIVPGDTFTLRVRVWPVDRQENDHDQPK